MALFRGGPRSNITQVVSPMYQGIIQAEKQKGQAVREAMGAFGKAIDPKTIGMRKFKEEFANADWTNPETYKQASIFISEFDPSAAMQFGQMYGQMQPKSPKVDQEGLYTIEGQDKPVQAFSYETKGGLYYNNEKGEPVRLPQGSVPYEKTEPEPLSATPQELKELFPDLDVSNLDKTAYYSYTLVDNKPVLGGKVSGTGNKAVAFDSAVEALNNEYASSTTMTGVQYNRKLKAIYAQYDVPQDVSVMGGKQINEMQGTNLDEDASFVVYPNGNIKPIGGNQTVVNINEDTPVKISEVLNIQKDFVDQTKGDREIISVAKDIINLASQGFKDIQQSSILKDRLVSRLYGGSDQKAQAELNTFRQAGSISKRLADSVTNFFAGTYTQETIDGFVEYARFKANQAQNSYNTKLTNQINSLSVSPQLTEEDLKQILGKPIELTKELDLQNNGDITQGRVEAASQPTKALEDGIYSDGKGGRLEVINGVAYEL